ncbi:Holo-[acyl-carrier-protein] synthase [bioreactor metagenome]|uniref:Holo-[acyl-carrier-protein] synthase n=1 Tax=bioreactor metagenome TaxID=1076179 RepID=A0A645H1Q9_9ZZZZ
MAPPDSRFEHDSAYAPRIGCDLAEAASIVESIQVFGERYLARVYTDTERHQSQEAPDRLAARFAGKEAVLKVLRTTAGISFRDVEIIDGADGAPQVRLHRQARTVAHTQQLGPIGLSLSHERGMALATAISLPTHEKS